MTPFYILYLIRLWFGSDLWFGWFSDLFLKGLRIQLLMVHNSGHGSSNLEFSHEASQSRCSSRKKLSQWARYCCILRRFAPQHLGPYECHSFKLLWLSLRNNCHKVNWPKYLPVSYGYSDGLRAGRKRNAVGSPAGEDILLFSTEFKQALGPIHTQMGTEGSFLRSKAKRAWSWPLNSV